MRAAIVAVALLSFAVVARAQPIDGDALRDQLGASDRATVERAIAAIAGAPAETPGLDELLRSAGRACEDTLGDPARAIAIYERILREFPHAAAARHARVRIDYLRIGVGSDGRYAREAAELAKLRAEIDRTPVLDAERKLVELAAAQWPGAPEAALFHAEWLQRTGRLADAQRQFAEVAARWRGTVYETTAIRGGADNALRRKDWTLAESLARMLPHVEPADRVMRDELLAGVARGRRFAFWYIVAWLAFIAILVGLAGSLADAVLRGGLRWPRPRPPTEVMFLLPVTAVLVGVSLTTHQLIAPAVITLSIGGLALTWLSGTTLDILRARGRRIRARAILHITACFLAVGALLYIVLLRDNLLEMMVETIRFGPE